MLGGPWIVVGKMHMGASGGGGGVGWRVNNAALGVTDHRFAIVVAGTFVGKVGMILFEEPVSATRGVLLGTGFARVVGEVEFVGLGR